MRRFIGSCVRTGIFVTMIAGVLLAGCRTTSETPVLTTTRSPQSVTARDLQIVTGQVVYVPAYSEVFYGRVGLSMELAVTLAVHNTDLDQSIVIQSVRYYDTDGNMVRDYIDAPMLVSPLATTGFLVEDTDRSGGWGANFIVEWGAETPVYEPIIEAIMVSTRGTHGISIISPGRVISQTLPQADSPAEPGQ